MALTDAELVLLAFIAFIFAMTCVMLGRWPKRKHKKVKKTRKNSKGKNTFSFSWHELLRCREDITIHIHVQNLSLLDFTTYFFRLWPKHELRSLPQINTFTRFLQFIALVTRVVSHERWILLWVPLSTGIKTIALWRPRRSKRRHQYLSNYRETTRDEPFIQKFVWLQGITVEK